MQAQIAITLFASATRPRDGQLLNSKNRLLSTLISLYYSDSDGQSAHQASYLYRTLEYVALLNTHFSVDLVLKLRCSTLCHVFYGNRNTADARLH